MIIAGILGILTLLICIAPTAQRIEKSLEGMSFVNGDRRNNTVTVKLKGFKRNYLLRKDKLDLAITISDFETDIQTLGVISPEYRGFNSITVVYYNPIENGYDFGSVKFNKDFSILIISGINESIYVASSNTDTNLEDIFRIYGE